MPLFAKDIIIIPSSGSISFLTTNAQGSITSSLNLEPDGGVSFNIPQNSSFTIKSGGTTLISSSIIISGTLDINNPLPSTIVSETPPQNSQIGSLWFNQTDGNTYIYYSASTWVPISTIPGDAIIITTGSNVFMDLGTY